MAKVYVIGDKDEGVLIVMLDPLRAALVTKKEIQSYGASHNKTYTQALSYVAAAIHGLIRKTDGNGDTPDDLDVLSHISIEYLLSTGKMITNAEFCFVSEVDDKKWKTFRNGFVPIKPTIGTLLESAPLFASGMPIAELAQD
ncbi:hypothetical protein Mesau_00566 [Mesorhizobium australicum WSM2073]|uniref:Uncharacterized protein n=1 Tax=Mesorhizobium australicum (strain HAMBI 3006 / LMG 24608 / WSM2073) TaxID=754035 RepID=L0KDG9_MESAW|nr:hypothetical protein [Mesorhizobium australicum]AGB43056.1 hypothetical protein Mesau_00566 [Mesorhizobium australicum WSM2073]